MKAFQLILTSWFLLYTTSLTSQTILMQPIPDDQTNIRLRFFHPSFDNFDDLTFFSGIFDLDVNIPVRDRWNIVVSLPYTSFSAGDMETVSSIGNLYLGAQTHSDNNPSKCSTGSFGIYLPTAGDDEQGANILAVFSQYHDLQKYLVDRLTLYANFAIHYYMSNGLIYGFELGPNIFIPSGSGEGQDTEFFLHYGLYGSVSSSDISFTVELVGLLALSAEGGSLSDKFFHTLSFGAGYNRWAVRPGIFYQAYLEEPLNDQVSGVLGIEISVMVN